MALRDMEEFVQPEFYIGWRLCKLWAYCRGNQSRDSMNLPHIKTVHGKAKIGEKFEIPKSSTKKWEPYENLFSCEHYPKPDIVQAAQLKVDWALCRLYPRNFKSVEEFLAARHWMQLEPGDLTGLVWETRRAEINPLTPEEALEWLYRYIS